MNWNSSPTVGIQGGIHWLSEWIPTLNRWSEPFLVQVTTDIFRVLETSDDAEVCCFEVGEEYYVNNRECAPARFRTRKQWMPVIWPDPPC